MKEKELWVSIELMGHERTAGRYAFENGLHRVDVPTDDGFVTEMIGSGAIFRMTFVDEAAARLIARSVRPRPIEAWEIKAEMRRLAAPASTGDVIVSDNDVYFSYADGLDDPDDDDDYSEDDDDL